MLYRLSPSDLTFLYEGCKHCFVLKAKHGIPQPSIPLPGVFSIIASLQKNHYSGRRTEDFCPQMPPGVVRYGEKQVRSKILAFPDLEGSCFIAGRFDIVAELDDRSYAVIDFKTGDPSEAKAGMYGRQLHAYVLALENSADGALSLSPVSTLGLLYFTPDACQHLESMRQVLEGTMQWIQIPRDDASFRAFLRDVVALLDGPTPAPEPDNCNWCRYRQRTMSLADPARPDAEATPSCPFCEGPMRLQSGRYGEFWSCLNYPVCRGTRNA